MKHIVKFLNKIKSFCLPEGKGGNKLFAFALVLLSLYVEAIVFLRFAFYSKLFTREHLKFSFIMLFLCILAVILIEKIKPMSSLPCLKFRQSNKSGYIFFASVFVVTLGCFLIWYIAFFPGSFSPDSIAQYQQALTDEYDNWHPAFHTWLFFKLPVFLFGTPSAIVLLQIIYFSLAVAYLFYTLKNSSCPLLFMILSWVYIIVNPNTTHIMLYPWKDTALAIFSLVIFTQVMKIYETGGKWLKSKLNILSFSIFLFLALSVRHNSLLLIAPIFVVLFVFMKAVRRNIVASALIVLSMTLILNGPVFTLVGVQKAGHRSMETLGLPLTVLSEVYMTDRESMSEEAIGFMSSLATEDEWKKYHVLGNFNVLKFSVDEVIFDKVENEGTGKILKYTLEAVINSPIASIRSFSHLTSLVWGFGDCGGSSIGVSIVDNAYGISYSGDNEFRELLNGYSEIVGSGASVFFNYIGIINLLLLVCGVARIKKAGAARVFVLISPLCYNFGTMLLLTGPDFRFFYFNFLIVIPILYLLFGKDSCEDALSVDQI